MEEYQGPIMGEGCPAEACQEAKVTVPFTFRAFAKVGNVGIKCKGEPIVTYNSDEAPGEHDAVSKFTISERICLHIPVVFGAEAEVGKDRVDYKNKNICGCEDEEKYEDDQGENGNEEDQGENGNDSHEDNIEAGIEAISETL